MKSIKLNSRPVAAGGLIALLACGPVGAANLLKLDNNKLLNDPASWNGGTTPGSGDVAQWSGLYLSTNAWSLGAAASWSGLQVLPATGFTLANDGNSLTLGASGIDLSLATNNLTLNPSVILGASQTWTVTNTRTLAVGGSVADGGNGFGITKAGLGTLSFFNANTFTGPLVINAGNVTVGTNATSSGVLNAGSALTLNNPAGGTAGTFGTLTVNAGAVVNGNVLVKTNSVSSAVNCTVNGTIAGNVTTEAGSGPASPNANATPLVGTGFINVNGGGSLAAGGYITNNGQVKFSGTAPVTFGTFIMTNGLGGIYDGNQAPKTFTFPSGSQLAYFQCASNAQSTLQVAGNGNCFIRYLGYNNANNASGPQLWSYTNTFNGGNWTIGYLSQNNSTCQYVGSGTLTGGANLTVTNNAGYVHGTWNIINGSLTFYSQLGENQSAGNAPLNIAVNNSGGGPSSFIITNGGYLLGFSSANTGPENNSLTVSNGGYAYIKGNLQVGTAAAANYPETNTLNLVGGKLVVNGILQSVTAAGAQDHVVNWTGGQLTALTITPGAGFNDPASGISSSTVSNTAGVLAPGDLGVAGKTTINGNYVQTAGGTLAVDLGGATAASAFTNAGSYYDVVAATGSATVAGPITANLLAGYTPAATSAYTILSAAGGLLATPGALGYDGYIPVYTNGALYGGKYFQALVAGNNLILTNYGVTIPPLAAKFTPTNAIGVAPVSPAFTDASAGVITNRHWVFGDGATLDTTSTTVAHTYAVIGVYNVTLTVTGADGTTSTARGTVRATATADQAVWKGGAGGNAWDTTTANWYTNGVLGVYHDPDFVTFTDSGNTATPVLLTTLEQPSSVTFSNVAVNYTLAGPGYLTGNGGLALNGDGSSAGGTVTLLTTNNYSGATLVNFGTLQVGNGTVSGAIDDTTNIVVNGALVFNQTDLHSVGAVIAGYGALTKSGPGTLILNADNSAQFSGPVTINGGTLAVAGDNSLGQPNGSVAISNATLQVSSGGTLNRYVTLDGTNDTLNVTGTLQLQNPLAGAAAVTVGGSGTVKVDTGGATVTFPTNIVLNGASLDYNRSDTFTQPGVIAGKAATSALFNHGTATGNTNTLTLADGNNVFAQIVNYAPATQILQGSANSTNLVAGADLTGGGAFGVGNGGNAQLIVAGGTYLLTNSTLFGTIGGGFVPSDTFIVNGGTVIASWYGANAAATDGGLHFFRCNLEIDGGTLWTKVWGAAIAPGFAASFNMNGGTFRLDDSGTLPGATAATTFFGLGLGNHSFASAADRYNSAATVTQTGGAVILAASTNNNVELGGANNAPTNNASTYTLSGGLLSAIGGVKGGNFNLGGSADGASTALLTLADTGKIVVSGAIQGYAGAAGSQAFTFAGGTLVAGGVNMTALADALNDPVGTLVNNGGTLAPGDAGVAGKTTITGNYTESAGATLAIDLNGPAAATAFTNSGAYYDTVAVTGTATLGGNLIVSTNGYTPAAGSQFTILTAGSVTGTFANVLNGRVTVSGSTNTFTVQITANSVILGNFSGAGSATPAPASITSSYNGTALTLNWPAGQGWRLQAQTNRLATGLGTNWNNVTGATPPFTTSPNPLNGTVFYRLVNP